MHLIQNIENLSSTSDVSDVWNICKCCCQQNFIKHRYMYILCDIAYLLVCAYILSFCQIWIPEYPPMYVCWQIFSLLYERKFKEYLRRKRIQYFSIFLYKIYIFNSLKTEQKGFLGQQFCPFETKWFLLILTLIFW